LRTRENAILRRPDPERKLTALKPVDGDSDVATVELDKIECQVVESGTDLIDRLSSEDSYLRRRRLDDLYCLFAVRLENDFVRLTFGINGDAR
jgi:hypothetical protein